MQSILIITGLLFLSILFLSVYITGIVKAIRNPDPAVTLKDAIVKRILLMIFGIILFIACLYCIHYRHKAIEHNEIADSCYVEQLENKRIIENNSVKKKIKIKNHRVISLTYSENGQDPQKMDVRPYRYIQASDYLARDRLPVVYMKTGDITYVLQKKYFEEKSVLDAILGIRHNKNTYAIVAPKKYKRDKITFSFQ